MYVELHPNAPAATFYLSQGCALPGFRSSENRHAGELGNDLLEKLQSFSAQFSRKTGSPVMFPPGRARLTTKPLPTGSLSFAMTMGIVEVTCFGGPVIQGPAVIITLTLRRINSETREGRRSNFPSA